MPISCFEMAAFITEDPNCRCGVAQFGRNGRTRGVYFFKAGKAMVPVCTRYLCIR